MRLVIADTGPVNYLIQIGHIELLPRMFDKVALPVAVQAELSDPLAPLPVRRWIAAPPAWLEIHDTAGLPHVSGLDEGETAAIALAESLHADLLLIDERDGFRVALRKGLRVTGTLGLLDLAAGRGLVDFVLAIKKLEQTTFRRPEAILESLLKKHRGRSDG
ncbi:Pin domain nucleic acid-binding protein [Candidatus Sulfopaludibacter sp. SbA4]|nr:Pin domain nucleic acid-binding protein [Candidatus Sulfopaludibacter sp. SbA4]